MSVFEFALTYVVSWCILLFMVLPFWVKTAENPLPGHAPSAPVQPMLKRKFMIAAVIAFIPPLVLMGISSAHAAEGIYTTKGSKCRTLEPYTPPPDLKAVDSNATLNPQHGLNLDKVTMNLDIPATNYLDADKYNADLSESRLAVGKLAIGQDGSATFNERSIGASKNYTQECME